jgi:hypothetical protein
MGKPYRNADHTEKLLTDDLDQTATLLYAEMDGQIVGTVRINWGSDRAVINAFHEAFSLEMFRDIPNSALSFCSRLMVNGRLRRSPLAANLSIKSYQLGRERGVKLNFSHTAPKVAPLFQHMGFRKYKDEIEDEEVGRQIPLVLLLEDVEHLKAMGSPFLTEATQYKNSPAIRYWFEKQFGNRHCPNNNNSGMENKKMTSTVTGSPELSRLQKTVNQVIQEFPQNEVCRRVDKNDFTIADYQKVLRMIFNQTHEAPVTFALAGVNCPPRLQTAREYLLHHANEEKSHWQWVVSALSKTGYQDTDFQSQPPLAACQNFVAFNYYVALKMPVARLAVAAVLEGIGAQYGRDYSKKICRLLQLSPEQAQFYVGHAETDRQHIVDIWRVIGECDLTTDEWQWMEHAAQTAGRLYRAMYDEALNQQC